jgi:hypothetical protein
MPEEDLPIDDPEEEVVEEEESEEVVEEDDSEIPEQWRKLDKKGLAKVLRDKDSFIGKLQDEKRRVDAEVARQAGRLETLEEQYQRLSSQSEPKEEAFEFDYDKPAESISNIVTRTLEKREKQTTEQSRKMLFDKCSRAHNDGFAAAVAANPSLFEGIETEVNNTVFAGFNPSVVNGFDVSDDLRKADTFTKVAKYLRVDRGEYDYLTKDKIEPVSSDPTERPQSGSSTGTRKSPKSLLTPRIQEMMKEMHISEEEALALAKEVQDEQRSRR